MDKSANRVTADKSEQPQNHEYHENGPQHAGLSFQALEAKHGLGYDNSDHLVTSSSHRRSKLKRICSEFTAPSFEPKAKLTKIQFKTISTMTPATFHF